MERFPSEGGTAAGPPVGLAERPVAAAHPAPSSPDRRAAGSSATRAGRPAPRGRLGRFGRTLTRPRRVLLALVAVWVVSTFDLYFTLQERAATHFVELNPLAGVLLDQPPLAVATFKFALLAFGSVILVTLRRHSVTELAAWFLLAVKIYVAVRWFVYFDSLVTSKIDPFITWPPGG